MKSLFIIVAIFFFLNSIQSQNLTGEQLLEKAINYHDPSNNWESFKGELSITMEIPNKPDRVTELKINLPEEYFYSKATSDNATTEFILAKEDCKILYNGTSDFTNDIAKEKRLSCDRANMYKNYYTYLFGLPMKLKDPGTIVDNNVERKSFKGKEYLVLKVTYKVEIGKDIWYFYFNPKTFAMEVYQFFHEEDKNDGEYILLSEIEIINDIKMPKIRAWYTNNENKLLGIDILN